MTRRSRWFAALFGFVLAVLPSSPLLAQSTGTI
ncbi:MAG: hypothetical protein RLZZ621_538, partial [Gemmatimonadota bacterium]